MKNIFKLFLILSVVLPLPQLAFAKHACQVGEPLESCSHETVSCTDINANIRYGSKNENVMILQKYLATYGYLNVAPTAYFGPLTLSAVKSFQEAHDIENTGFVGPLTRGQLKKNSCTQNTSNTTVNPVACTKDIRYCSDGSIMARSTSTCAWLSNLCPVTPSTSSTTYWDTTKAKPLSGTLLDSLKAALSLVGINTNSFATTTMSEAEILNMTKKFEQDYIFSK